MSNDPLPQEIGSGDSPRRQETMGVLLLRLGLRECLKSLMNHLSQKVLDLEKEKDAQAVEILKLKQRMLKGRDSSLLLPKSQLEFQCYEDLTIAQTLKKMKEEKAKEKGVAIKDVEDSPRPIRSITTLQPLPTIYLKDKGKGVLVEEEPENQRNKKKGSRVLAQMKVMQELAPKIYSEEELAEWTEH
ncbi:hypothetical protein Tco_0465005 [Tanacetum coccineum]